MASSCAEEDYVDFGDLMSASSVPVYLVPGDNEYNDCPNPQQALQYWNDHLGSRFERKHWPKPSGYTVSRQGKRPENFAFVLNGVLFLGLNLVGGTMLDDDTWKKRHEENLEWVDLNVQRHGNVTKQIVILAHAGSENYRAVDFYTPLAAKIEDEYKLPLVVVRVSNPNYVGKEIDKIQDDIAGVEGYSNVHVDKSVWPAMRIEIHAEDGAIDADQRSWYDRDVRDWSAVSTFYAMAGKVAGPDLPNSLGKLPSDDNEFLVHLGDWNANRPDACPSHIYRDFGDLMSDSSVPVYLVPGDNEYNDCPDPEEAFSFWAEHLGEYERKHWPAPTECNVVRQTSRNENFAFRKRGILFIGLNLVGGEVHDEDEWSDRMKDDLAWVDLNIKLNEAETKTVVLFAHTGSENYRTQDFYEPLAERIKDDYQKPTVVVRVANPDWAGQEVLDKVEDDVEGLEDYKNVHVDGGVWPPMRVRIDSKLNTFYVDQYSWL